MEGGLSGGGGSRPEGKEGGKGGRGGGGYRRVRGGEGGFQKGAIL